MTKQPWDADASDPQSADWRKTLATLTVLLRIFFAIFMAGALGAVMALIGGAPWNRIGLLVIVLSLAGHIGLLVRCAFLWHQVKKIASRPQSQASAGRSDNN